MGLWTFFLRRYTFLGGYHTFINKRFEQKYEWRLVGSLFSSSSPWIILEKLCRNLKHEFGMESSSILVVLMRVLKKSELKLFKIFCSFDWRNFNRHNLTSCVHWNWFLIKSDPKLVMLLFLKKISTILEDKSVRDIPPHCIHVQTLDLKSFS